MATRPTPRPIASMMSARVADSDANTIAPLATYSKFTAPLPPEAGDRARLACIRSAADQALVLERGQNRDLVTGIPIIVNGHVVFRERPVDLCARHPLNRRKFARCQRLADAW